MNQKNRPTHQLDSRNVLPTQMQAATCPGTRDSSKLLLDQSISKPQEHRRSAFRLSGGSTVRPPKHLPSLEKSNAYPKKSDLIIAESNVYLKKSDVMMAGFQKLLKFETTGKRASLEQRNIELTKRLHKLVTGSHRKEHSSRVSV